MNGCCMIVDMVEREQLKLKTMLRIFVYRKRKNEDHIPKPTMKEESLDPEGEQK